MFFYRLHLLIAITFVFLLFVNCDGKVLDERSLVLSDSILLEGCYNESRGGYTWTFQDVVIFINKQFINKEWRNGIELLSNGSLYFKSALLSNEGIYRCLRDSTTLTEHNVTIEVPPKLFLLYDNAILANASYHKDHGYEMYHGDNTYVAENKTINVTCLAEGAKPKGNITWMINGEIMDNVSHQVPKPNLQENRTFDSLSTLQFSPSGNFSTVTCNFSLDGTDIEASASATFLTYVEPRVFVLLNGSRVNKDEVYVDKNETVKITCCAEGSRPPANLTWEENYDYVESSQGKQTDTNSSTFDTCISMTILPGSNIETITCRSSIVEINLKDTFQLKINTYVLREPSITFNGKSYDVIPVNSNDSETLICNGAGSTPQTTLTWKINGRLPQEPTHKVSQSLDLSNLILTFKPKDNDMVECYSYLDGPNITRVVNVTFHVNHVNGSNVVNDIIPTEKPDSFDYMTNVIVPFVSVTLTILLVFCVYFATRRFRNAQSTDLTALQLALRDRPFNGVNHMTRDLPSIRRSMIIPPDEENVEINCDEGKTSTVTNVELGVHLPGEGTFQYWTANASFKNENNKKIIAKCVSENVKMKEHLNFRTLADSLKTITNHRNIIEILGVSTTSVPYYIYMEYLEYGTLRDFLMRNYQQSRDSQSNIAQTLDERAIHLTGFALDVADGLIYLTDRDYRHPALCAKKILLTKTGICKLYDFWPKALSTERINQILQKSHPPVAWLSPETIFLRHYSEKSDVWNFGVVLWEIYSLGEIPYSGLTCEEIEQEIRKMRYLDQPLTCPGGIFSMMLASWDTTVDERPDFSEWKQKLVCLLQSARQALEDQDGTKGTGDQSYFTLENNICDYEDDYIEQ